MSSRLTLAPRRWYGLQTVGGDGEQGDPFAATPIFVAGITPLKTGKGLLALDLVRLIRPLRAAYETLTLRVCYHAHDALLARPEGSAGAPLLAITPITIGWMEQHCLRVLKRFEPSSWSGFWGKAPDPQEYLGRFFGYTPEAIVLGTAPVEHFRLQPMGDAHGTLEMMGLNYEGLDVWFLLRGVMPQEMEDKWFIHAVGDDREGRIDIHRSWTGLLVWSVDYRITDGRLSISSARVNLDQAERTFGTREQEAEALTRCLEGFALGRPDAYAEYDYPDHDMDRSRADWGLGARP